MSPEEARIIAVWRLHYHATFTKVGQLAIYTWGLEGAQALSCRPFESPALIGRELISAMERTLGYQACETDTLVLKETLCRHACGRSFFEITPDDGQVFTDQECECQKPA